jgi:hypothetical protein
MAKLNTGTRIYGTANVDTSVTVGTSTITTGTGALLANVTTLFIGNNTVNAYLNTIGLNVNNATIANTLGFYTTGTINAASHTVGTSFIANTTQLTITTPTSANGSVGTAGYILASNGATGSPYWRDTVRINTQVSSASVTIDATLYDTYVFTALGAGLTFNASTSASNGDKIIIRIKDDGTARALTWTGTGSAGGFRPIGLTLPSTTTVSKTLYVGLVYNTDGATALWDAIAYTIEA